MFYFCASKRMYSAAEENYLKSLYALQELFGEVSATELSKRLSIKMPSVNSMMKKLLEKGLVQYESYRPITLTEKGRLVAAQIIRKHRLTEMFLVEKMGFSWDEVHGIAEQIEHIDSPEFFMKMDEILEHPAFDPHGSPIPDAEGKITNRRLRKLSECAPGDAIFIKAVSSSDETFLKFLTKKNIQIGSKVEVLHAEEYDGSVSVLIDERFNEVLSQKVCERLLVSVSG